tara:strand:+ start:87 stop:374 length:288 start_codon:yes stop_codon:yes gene_type:complete
VEQQTPEGKRLQQNLEQTFLEINNEIFIGGGTLYTVTAASSAAFEIPTGRTQAVRGFVVLDTNVSATFFRTETIRDKTICTIKPSAAGTYKFWVF